MEIDSTREKDSQKHKGGLGSYQRNWGETIAKDILSRIDQQERKGGTQILSIESTNKRKEARPKSFQQN